MARISGFLPLTTKEILPGEKYLFFEDDCVALVVVGRRDPIISGFNVIGASAYGNGAKTGSESNADICYSLMHSILNVQIVPEKTAIAIFIDRDRSNFDIHFQSWFDKVAKTLMEASNYDPEDRTSSLVRSVIIIGHESPTPKSNHLDPAKSARGSIVLTGSDDCATNCRGAALLLDIASRYNLPLTLVAREEYLEPPDWFKTDAILINTTVPPSNFRSYEDLFWYKELIRRFLRND